MAMTGGGLVLAALLAALIGQHQDWGTGDSSGSEAGPPAAAPPAEPDDDEPAPDDDGSADEAREPDWSGLHFMDLHGAQLPVSPVHGPEEATVQKAEGFSRDVGGAVMAGVHLATRVSYQVGPEVYEPAVEQMVGEPGTRSAFLAQLDADYTAARDASGLPEDEPLRVYAQVIGYAVPGVVDADVEQVTVHLLSRGAGPHGGEILMSFPLTLTWSTEEDWRLRVPAGGEWSGHPVTGTEGYTLFSEVVDNSRAGAD